MYHIQICKSTFNLPKRKVSEKFYIQCIYFNNWKCFILFINIPYYKHIIFDFRIKKMKYKLSTIKKIRMKYIFGIPIKPAIQIIWKEGIPTLFGLLESKEVKRHLHIITKPNSESGRRKLGFNTFMDVGSHLAFQDLSGITEGCGCIICQYRHKMHQTERKIERLEKEAIKYYRLISANPSDIKLQMH